MPTTVNFPGGSSGPNSPFFSTTGNFAASDGSNFPLAANGVRQNLTGNYIVRVASLSPYNVSGNYSAYILKNGTLYGAGSTISLTSAQLNNSWQARIYNNGGTVTFNRAASGTGFTGEYNSSGTLVDSWNSAMTGTWSWATVPTTPASISVVVNGTSATITRGNSTADTSYPVTSYSIQRRESTNGTTWGAWTNTTTMVGSTHTYTGLSAAKYYQFRVYASNSIGTSQAVQSTTVFIAAVTRYDGSSFVLLSKLKRYNGTSWENIGSAKRWNGTTWETIDISSIPNT